MLPIVGIGAGLVSALLFAVVTTGSPLAIILYSVAPLPIFIAALGWNHRAGLAAAAAGASPASGSRSRSTGGLVFALIVALPAWWFAYLALLARSDGTGDAEWYPLGSFWSGSSRLAALVTVGSVVCVMTHATTTPISTVIARMHREPAQSEMVRSRRSCLPADMTVPSSR